MHILKVCMQNYLFCGKTLQVKKICSRFGHAALRCNEHRLQNIKFTSAKCFTSTSSSSNDENWPKIYGLRWMPYIAAFNRFKLYQTILAVFSVPLCSALYTSGTIGFLTVQLIGGAAIAACTTLYLFSFYFRRLIGLIHFNEGSQIVKISHLTFWGRKKIIYVPMQDIVPLTDGNCRAKDAYVKVHRYSTKDFLLLSLKFGQIINKKEFERIFGNLEFLYSTNK